MEEIEVTLNNGHEPATYTTEVFEELIQDEAVEEIISTLTGELYFIRSRNYISRDFYVKEIPTGA